jgi:hypothetical protein
MVAEYDKLAADHGHSEAKLNHNRCFRLFSKWEPSDRSSDAVSHQTSIDHLFGIFQGFIKDSEPLDEDSRRLLRSFERLKTPTTISVSSELNGFWIQNAL